MPMLGRRSFVAASIAAVSSRMAFADPAAWRSEWPRTDFSKTEIDLNEIMSGGPPKDGIPAIDNPHFVPVAAAADLDPRDPVIGLILSQQARAYPLRIMIWHEIVNDVVGGVPVAVTYCPLCNSAIIFDRRVPDRTLSFGTTGKLRHSDLVMYDRETESWWQQFVGRGIVGFYAGHKLASLPARLESFSQFQQRAPKGSVLVPSDPSRRPYGRNPYAGYDQAAWPFLYKGSFQDKIAPLARVIVVGTNAWPLDLLRKRRRIEWEDLILTWNDGQASALDTPEISSGWDVGNVVVQRRSARGPEDVVYDVALAFAFRAFHPNGVLHSR